MRKLLFIIQKKVNLFRVILIQIHTLSLMRWMEKKLSILVNERVFYADIRKLYHA